MTLAMLLWLPIRSLAEYAQPASTTLPDQWTQWTEQQNVDQGGHEERAFLAAGVVDGTLYAVGGTDGFKSLATVRSFDPREGFWRDRAPMPTPRSHLAVAVANGMVYAIGGAGEGSGAADSMGRVPLSTMEAFDPRTNRWSVKSSMPTARYDLSATNIGGMIYAIGGRNQKGAVGVVEVYDPRRDVWTRKASLPIPVATRGAAGVVDGIVYLLGGNFDGGCLDKVQAYNPNTDAWKVGSTIPVPDCYLTTAVLGDVMKAFGALDRAGSKPRSDVLTFLPKSDTWKVAGLDQLAFEGFALGDVAGTIYLVGGTQDGAYRTGLRMFHPGAIPSAGLETDSAVQENAFQSDVDEAPNGSRRRQDDFALIVGVERYRNVAQADFAHRDAVAFGKYAHSVLGVPEQNIIVLLDDQASESDLAKYLEAWLPRNVSRKSRVFFYFSGHGAPDAAGKTSYLVPWDGDPSFLKTRAFSLPRLYQDLSSLPAKEVIAFLDTCFSGNGPRSVATGGLRPLVSVKETAVPRNSRLTVLTAASGNEVAGTFQEQGHGIFTYFVLRDLKMSRDHLHVDSLYDFVKQNVSAVAHRQNREQDPQLFTSDPDLSLY